MTRRFRYGPLLALAALAGSAALVWHFRPQPAPPAPDAPPAVQRAAEPAVAAAPPVPVHPIEAVPVPQAMPDAPIPALSGSDDAFLTALGAVPGGEAASLLVRTFVIQRIVTTVDNLDGTRLTRPVYAAQPIPGELATASADGRLWLDAGNARRYDAAIALVERVDLRQAVGVYVRFYPLFQQAYRELGVDRPFNDRLVAIIDHLLAAPETGPAIELVRDPTGGPRLRYADPRLESASVGHKAMWRIGPDHRARVQARLRALRELLAAQRPAA